VLGAALIVLAIAGLFSFRAAKRGLGAIDATTVG